MYERQPPRFPRGSRRRASPVVETGELGEAGAPGPFGPFISEPHGFFRAAGALTDAEDLKFSAAAEGPAAWRRKMAAFMLKAYVFRVLDAIGGKNDGGRKPGAADRVGGVVEEGKDVGVLL